MNDIQNSNNMEIEKKAERINKLLIDGVTEDDDDLLELRKALLKIWPDPPSNK